MFKFHLEEMGFMVFDVSPSLCYNFKYSSLRQRAYNLIRKVFYNDYSYKQRLLSEAKEQEYAVLKQQLPSADYVFFIRPDLFPLDFVQAAIGKASKSVAYQWDSLKRYSGASRYVSLFDRFFVFDLADISRETLPLTNFILDEKQGDAGLGPTSMKKNMKSALFIGSYYEERFGDLCAISECLEQYGLEVNRYLITYKRRDRKVVLNSGSFLLKEFMSYADNLRCVQDHDVLIDAHTPVNEGLSFRAFEAMRYNKKLITTNRNIVRYDFYNPANIFVWGLDDAARMKSFLTMPCQVVPRQIQSKYSFENWIKYVLGDGNYQAIDIPR